MSVKLQLSTQSGLVSDVIREWTRAWCSHVDIVIPDLYDAATTYPILVGKAGWLLGARSNAEGGFEAGVQIRSPGYAPFSKTEIVELPATPQQEYAFLNFLLAQVGKPYDKTAIAGLALDRDWRKADEWFCSELAMAALEEAEIVHRLSSPVNFISPRDILMIGETLRVAA